MTSLTADGVLQAKFQPTRFREGYDQDEVDDFLDTVTAILRSHEAGERIDARAAVDLCRNARFQPTKFREGYDQHQVDDLLARLEHDFRMLAGGAADAPVRTASPAPSDGPAPSHGPASSIGSSAPATDSVATVLDHRPGEYPVRRLPVIGLLLVVGAAVGVVALMVWMFAL